MKCQSLREHFASTDKTYFLKNDGDSLHECQNLVSGKSEKIYF